MFNSDDDSENDADYEPPAEESEDEVVVGPAEKSYSEDSISKKEELIYDKVYQEKVWENFLANSKSNPSSITKSPDKIPETNDISKHDADEKLENIKISIKSIECVEKNTKKQLPLKDLCKEERGVKRLSTLDTIMGKVNKKTKVTTLQKSIDDWNTFKREEGIENSLRIYNKGKGGYIQKQEFLLKSDLASFEKERELRLSKK